MSSASASTRYLPSASLGGVAAFLAGYLFVYVTEANHVRDQFAGTNAVIQFFGGQPIPAWKAVGWVFYNAHFVAVTYPGLGGRTSHNLVSSGDASAILYLVPVVALFLAGFFVGRYADTATPAAAAVAGVLVTPAYFVLAVVGLWVFRANRGGTWMGSDPITGALLAGLVYPIVLGAVGGYVAGLVE